MKPRTIIQMGLTFCRALSFKETLVDWQIKGKNEFDSLNFTPTRNPTELFFF